MGEKVRKDEDLNEEQKRKQRQAPSAKDVS